MGEWDGSEVESFEAQQQDAQPSWQDVQDLMAGYVLGELSPEEATRFQSYLAMHPEAVAELSQLQVTLNLLPLALPETALPPSALGAAILRDAVALGQESAATLNPPSSTQLLRLRSGLPWLGVAIATGLAIAGGLTTRQLRQELRLAQQQLTQAEVQSNQMRSHLAQTQSQLDQHLNARSLLQQANNRLLPLNGAGPTAASSGSIVIAPQVQTAVLTLQKLPPPPAGSAYQLWAMLDGQKVYCAEFKPDAQGRVFIEIPIRNWADAPSVVITLEKAGTIPKGTGAMVLSSPLI